MKLNGVKPSANVVYCILPRGTNPSLDFKFEALLDLTEFDLLCPAPKPPMIVRANGQREARIDDPTYRTQVNQYGTKKFAWMFLKSIANTAGLEWETIDMQDHRTWLKYHEELKASGLSQPEIDHLIAAFSEANCLNEAKLQDARDAFLRGLAAAQSLTSGPISELPNTSSGVPVNDSESNPQE